MFYLKSNVLILYYNRNRKVSIVSEKYQYKSLKLFFLFYLFTIRKIKATIYPT